MPQVVSLYGSSDHTHTQRLEGLPGLRVLADPWEKLDGKVNPRLPSTIAFFSCLPVTFHAGRLCLSLSLSLSLVLSLTPSIYLSLSPIYISLSLTLSHSTSPTVFLNLSLSICLFRSPSVSHPLITGTISAQFLLKVRGHAGHVRGR